MDGEVGGYAASLQSRSSVGFSKRLSSFEEGIFQDPEAPVDDLSRFLGVYFKMLS